VLASLGGQHALGLVTVSLALAVLLVRILHGDLFINQILAVHVGDGGVGGLEVAKRDEAVAFGQVIVVAGDLRSLARQPAATGPTGALYLGHAGQVPEARERVVQNMLGHHGIEVTDEQLGADLDRLLLISRGLVHANRLSVQPDAVHDARGILGVLLADELDEAVALVRLGDAVFGQVDVDDAAGLQHQLPDQAVDDALIEVSDVDGGLFVLLPGWLA
jgi:hypothetical protein